MPAGQLLILGYSYDAEYSSVCSVNTTLVLNYNDNVVDRVYLFSLNSLFR